MILIDPLVQFPTKLRAFRGGCCHMVSDTSEVELHAFAARIGLKREWAQLRPKSSAAHYDLTATKRALAVELGAAEVSARELAMRNYDGLRRRGLLAMPEGFCACGRRREDVHVCAEVPA